MTEIQRLLRKLNMHEARIKTLEALIETVPCCIHENQRCKDPFCRFSYYMREALNAREEWEKSIRRGA